MGVEELSTAIMSELGWISFSGIIMSIVFGIALIAVYVKLDHTEEKLNNLVARTKCIHENQYMIADELDMDL